MGAQGRRRVPGTGRGAPVLAEPEVTKRTAWTSAVVVGGRAGLEAGLALINDFLARDPL